MITKFLNKYKITDKLNNIKTVDVIDNKFLYDLISNHGGEIFNNGLFKIHTFEMMSRWTDLISDIYFKDETKGISLYCFASNWQGCMYCINKENNLIIYFDPSTCEFFECEETSVEDFFDSILVEGEYDIIFEEYFEEAKDYMKFGKVNYDESVGHIIYLHLGGEDDVNNLEIVNTEVLWELQIEVAKRINEITD
jgi:hypothetical protein